MMRSLKPGTAARDRPGGGGQRWRAALHHAGNGGLRHVAEQPGIECRDIHIGNDVIRRNLRPTRQLYAAGPAIAHQDLVYFGKVVKFGACRLGARRNDLGQPVHAALRHTPICSAWAISISVAGAVKGEQPQ